MSRAVVPVILSGGAGSRLWPLSRELHPKQFLALAGELSLLQATARRLATVGEVTAPIVVCNEAHRFMVAEQLDAVGVVPAAILLEPAARNTAPAIAVAAFEAVTHGRASSSSDRSPGTAAVAFASDGERGAGEADHRDRGDPGDCGGSSAGDAGGSGGNDAGDAPILLILPVDHVVRDEARFAAAVRDAAIEAAAGRLVTFGVPPAHPETGYGYIRAGAPAGVTERARRVERFVEKPDSQAAAAFVDDGRYYWNSGMFVFGAARFLRELAVYAKEVHTAAAAAHRDARRDLGFLRLDPRAFAASPSVSVDHAVMERTSAAVMVPLEAGWSDIGSWSALAKLGEGDDAGNVTHGDVLLEGARNTYVRGAERLVAAVGVTDLVIADTADALLVAGKGAADDLKNVVAALASAGRGEHRHHRMVHRPWGSYDVLHGGDGFKVKRIVVNPGQRLSLQSHRHRAEHWIVVRGAARVTRGEETFIVAGERIGVHPTGNAAPAGESGRETPRAGRSADRGLPRGGRHRPPRRRLRARRRGPFPVRRVATATAVRVPGIDAGASRFHPLSITLRPPRGVFAGPPRSAAPTGGPGRVRAPVRSSAARLRGGRGSRAWHPDWSGSGRCRA